LELMLTRPGRTSEVVAMGRLTPGNGTGFGRSWNPVFARAYWDNGGSDG